MLQSYLINILFGCLIVLVLALIVGAIQMAVILIDIRKVTGETKAKVLSAMSVVDVASVFFSGLVQRRRWKKKAAEEEAEEGEGSDYLAAAIAGLKKGLQVFFKKGGEKNE